MEMSVLTVALWGPFVAGWRWLRPRYGWAVLVALVAGPLLWAARVGTVLALPGPNDIPITDEILRFVLLSLIGVLLLLPGLVSKQRQGRRATLWISVGSVLWLSVLYLGLVHPFFKDRLDVCLPPAISQGELCELPPG